MTLFRIFTLVALQRGQKLNNRQSAKKVLSFLAIRFGILCAITAGYFVIFMVLKSFFAIPLTRFMLTFLLLFTQVISIISCTVAFNGSMYGSKDNAILLSFPVEYGEVYLSKLVVAYLNEFGKNLYFIVPLTLAFGIITSQNLWFFAAVIIITFILPLLAVLLGALISIPVKFITAFLKRARFVYVLLSAVIAVLLLIGINNVLKNLPDPLRILALYFTVIGNIGVFLSKVSNFALFYQWISDILFANNLWLNLGLVLLLIVVLIALNYLLSRPLFFKMASKTAEHSVQKKHKPKKAGKDNTYFAFLKKETILAVRTADTFLQDYLLIFCLPFVLYFVNGFFKAIDLSPRGESIALAINIIISLIMITSSNTGSATALSREGSEFVLLKTAPAKTYLVTWAKITINIVVSLTLIIISLIIIGLTGVISWDNLVWCLIAFVLIDIGHIFWSFQLDIRNPSMREYAALGQNASNNKNANNSVGYGLIIALFSGVLVFGYSFTRGKVIAYIVLIAISLIFALVRAYLFDLNLKCYFEDMEY